MQTAVLIHDFMSRARIGSISYGATRSEVNSAAPSFAAIAKRLFAFYGSPSLADELARAWSELMDRFEEKLKKIRDAA